ncbi:MAG: SLC13 family permease [Bacteroidota bacterium]|nr:SLC13 family permease [Bacteroidota bacterium]MDE2957924.1 SLC13 family permease [Bacteroidota bacterium]
MDHQGWITVCTLAAIIIALIRDLARPDAVFLSALGLLLVTGVLSPPEAFQGFAHPAVIAVGSLFVVAAGIEETGVLHRLGYILLGKSRSMATRLIRLMVPTALLSAFINNTPVVAMLTQPVQRWAAREGFSPSKVLIPLSYAAIAGGMATHIGTSTNVLVSGLLQSEGYSALSFFAFSWVGVPAAIVVVVFISFVGVHLLPKKSRGPLDRRSVLRNCLFEVRLVERSPLIGQTVAKAGLSAPGNAYIIHVRRDAHIMVATPDFILAEGDILGFSGDMTVLEDLLRRPDLEPAIPLRSRSRSSRGTLPLYEAVVSGTSNLVGKTLSDVTFLETYGAIVLALQRKTGRLSGALGSVALKAGDLLLVGALPGFEERWHSSHAEFYYVASRGTSSSKRPRSKAYVAIGILAVTIGLAASGLVPLTIAAFGGAVAMVLSGCLTIAIARQALDLQVLILIAAALGLAEAVTKTGLATHLGEALLAVSGTGLLWAMMSLYISTNVLTELINNQAAAVLMFPVAITMADGLGVSATSFALIIAVAASASFMTPVGYQTNLMVMSAGRYKVTDFMRVGIPVSMLVMCVTTLVIMLVWL